MSRAGQGQTFSQRVVVVWQFDNVWLCFTVILTVLHSLRVKTLKCCQPVKGHVAMIVCCALLCGWLTHCRKPELSTHHWHLCPFPSFSQVALNIEYRSGEVDGCWYGSGGWVRNNDIVYRCVWSLKYFEASYFRWSFDPRKCIWYVIHATSLIPSSRNMLVHHFFLRKFTLVQLDLQL